MSKNLFSLCGLLNIDWRVETCVDELRCHPHMWARTLSVEASASVTTGSRTADTPRSGEQHVSLLYSTNMFQ